MPLARIITRLPQETAALAEYLRTQGYTVETVSSADDSSSTLADLEISAEQYPLAEAMAHAREIAAQGWDIMVAPGVLEEAASLERAAEMELERPAESAAERSAELTRERPVEPFREGPMDAEQAISLPKRISEWTQAARAALSSAAKRPLAAGEKISAAAGLVLQISQREAARIAGRCKEFAVAQRSQSARRAANIAAKMKEIRRLREEREALETAARLRQREAEREARIRQAQEREERARVLQMEAERESQRRAEHAAQIEAEAEQDRIHGLQLQMQIEAEREAQRRAERAVQLRRMQIEAEAAERARVRELQRQRQLEAERAAPIHAESIQRESIPAHLDSLTSSSNTATDEAKNVAQRNKSAEVRRSSRRRRDWEMAFAGAAAATVVLILAFGVLGARRPAEKFAPTHAVEQQLPFGAATIRPAVSPPVVKENPPAPQSAPVVGQTAPKLVATASGAKRHNALPNDDSSTDSDAEVVVRHFAPVRAPAKPAAKKSADGVKHYSDIN